MLPSMRPYSGFLSFLFTSASLGCASYAYLVGASLATIGPTWVAIIGYWLGTVIAMALVVLAVGIPSFRSGLDTVDAAKAALGIRGALIFMLGIVFSCVGWGNVLIAMTARSGGVLVGMFAASGTAKVGANEGVVVAIALGLTLCIWWLTSKGPQVVATLTSWCVPGQALVAFSLLILLFTRYSAGTVLHAQVADGQIVTPDRHLQWTFAIEFGLNNGFTMTPFLGGLTRLVATRRILVTPPILGYASGAAFISGVAALATAVSGTTDPLTWLTIVAGNGFGALIMVFLMIANIGALVALIYLGGISIQQIGPLSRLPWKVTIGLLLLPSVAVAFRTTGCSVLSWNC